MPEHNTLTPSGRPECLAPSPCGEPGPGNLAYGFTLPCSSATPAIAHEVAEAVLGGHGVTGLLGPALLLVLELTDYACRFTPSGAEVYLNIRQREGVLRLTVYDTHPRHAQPRDAAYCDGLRRAALRLTPELARVHRGGWGIDAAELPAMGTRTWATLAQPAHGWTR
ncbi:ATP-binding protein [Streptomyces litchfieldiae]|uniref:ATP-binding protein n=1 Tax=Streptomyces litchfieldiae TaxID=3075543 RepID=A0ABU2MPN5_9ACTN|nr:ATP-binding protein [Streptomyces sp. DSM 44938]MDT0343510.1 ATP-binding protein [Streptomyces sp. DSM 44938]